MNAPVQTHVNYQDICFVQLHTMLQGRLRSQFMKEIRLMKEKVKTAEESEHKAFDESLAALRIQKTWRGYNIRTKMKRRKFEEMLLIGMLQPNFTEIKERRKAEEVHISFTVHENSGYLLIS